MNTINNVVSIAMDGQALSTSAQAVNASKEKTTRTIQTKLAPSGADVVKTIEQKMEETRADTRELQRITQIVAGSKLQFSVNKELDSVIVSVIDSETDKVIKQIPSEDMQKLKLRIRQAIGTLFDELV